MFDIRVDEPFKQWDDKEVLVLKEWLPSGIHAGISTRGNESISPFHGLNLALHVNDDKDNVRKNRTLFSDLIRMPLTNWVCADQVHQDRIMKLTKKHRGSGVFDYESALPMTDGLYTMEKGIVLTACFADCVPLYFYSDTKKIIGVAHAGWKGTALNIGSKMVHEWLEKENIPKDSIHVAIGPSIGACCYIVDDRVVKEMKKCLPTLSSQHISEISKGQYKLDLKQINVDLLIRAGVQPHHIQKSTFCTSCNNHLFFSHRKDNGNTGRMMSYITME